MVLTSEYLRN